MSATQIQSSTKLGVTGPEVFPIALGCMAMSGLCGQTSDDESIATIYEAIDRGINVIDTRDFMAWATTKCSLAGPYEAGATRCTRSRSGQLCCIQDNALIEIALTSIRSIGSDKRAYRHQLQDRRQS